MRMQTSKQTNKCTSPNRTPFHSIPFQSTPFPHCCFTTHTSTRIHDMLHTHPHHLPATQKTMLDGAAKSLQGRGCQTTEALSCSRLANTIQSRSRPCRSLSASCSQGPTLSAPTRRGIHCHVQFRSVQFSSRVH